MPICNRCYKTGFSFEENRIFTKSASLGFYNSLEGTTFAPDSDLRKPKQTSALI